MKCPKCGGEMETGYFYGQRALWSKNGFKLTVVRDGDDIRLRATGSPAYRCEKCKKMIVTIDYS